MSSLACLVIDLFIGSVSLLEVEEHHPHSSVLLTFGPGFRPYTIPFMILISPTINKIMDVHMSNLTQMLHFPKHLSNISVAFLLDLPNPITSTVRGHEYGVA
jgi:hypothetical protein